MASDKKRRKASKLAKKSTSPTGPVRHPDGDRRHREHGTRYREAYATKELLRKIGLPPEEPENM